MLGNGMLIVFLNTQQTTFIPCKLFFEVFIVSLDYTLHGNYAYEKGYSLST